MTSPTGGRTVVLEPDGRALLLDALRPPPGHSLDHAVATTFTLDLETALTVPLAFAGFRFDEQPDPRRSHGGTTRDEQADRYLLSGWRYKRRGVAVPIWWRCLRAASTR